MPRNSESLVHRSYGGQQAWCLCPQCATSHARSTRRTRHDRWALDGQDHRIRADLMTRP